MARRLKSLGEAYDIAQTPFDLQTLLANIEEKINNTLTYRIMITDGRILKALCKRLAQQINAKGLIYYERRYKYVDFTHVDDIAPAVFDKVHYKGHVYKLHFYSGCFSPYFIELKA